MAAPANKTGFAIVGRPFYDNQSRVLERLHDFIAMTGLRIPHFIASLLIWLALLNGTAHAQKSLLLVESYDSDFAWDNTYRQAIIKALGPAYRLATFEMDTKHLPKEQHAAMADRAWAKYLESSPDLVLLADDTALALLARRFAETKTPVVYLGINNNPRAYIPAQASNFTGILERPLLKRSIASITKILPGSKNILLLLDDDATSHIILQELFSGRRIQTIAGVQVEIVLAKDFSEWQNALRRANKSHNACIIGLYQALTDDKQRSVPESTVMHWSVTHASIPLFAFWDFAVGPNKTAGGLVFSGEDMGTQAALLVKRILEEGTPPSSITPVFNNAGKYVFSRQQLQRWRIALPPEIASLATFVE